MNRTTTNRCNVVVAGGGPAGLALTAALATAGVPVTCVDPAPDRPWPQTFGVFADQLDELGLGSVSSHRWPAPVVHMGGRTLELDRAYALVDNRALAARLRASAMAEGAELTTGRVESIEEDDDGATCTLGDGRVLRCGLFVDARGRSPDDECRSAQVALGRIVDVSRDPQHAARCLWMDFRGGHDDELPTFGYVLPIGDDRVLVEETSLASSPPMSFEALELRLLRRLDRIGLSSAPVLGEERVLIPLDIGVGAAGRASLRFGAAAGFVHPSTGYSLVRSLRSAGPVARAIADALPRGASEAARAGHRAAWPVSLRASRALHLAGLRVLLTLDAGHTRRFFDAFFHLPPELQAAWLDPTGHPASVSMAMARLFGQAPWSVRRDIFLGGLA